MEINKYKYNMSHVDALIKHKIVLEAQNPNTVCQQKKTNVNLSERARVSENRQTFTPYLSKQPRAR